MGSWKSNTSSASSSRERERGGGGEKRDRQTDRQTESEPLVGEAGARAAVQGAERGRRGSTSGSPTQALRFQRNTAKRHWGLEKEGGARQIIHL